MRSVAILAAILVVAGCGGEPKPSHKYPIGATFCMQPGEISHMTLEVVGYEGDLYVTKMYNNGYLLKFPGAGDTCLYSEEALGNDVKPCPPFEKHGETSDGFTVIEMPAGSQGKVEFNSDGTVQSVTQ